MQWWSAWSYSVDELVSGSLLWNAVKTQIPTAGGIITNVTASHFIVAVMEIWVQCFNWFYISNRDDQNVKDDRGEAAGTDASGAPTDAPQLYEHREGAAACPHIRCVCRAFMRVWVFGWAYCVVGEGMEWGVNAGHWASISCYSNADNYCQFALAVSMLTTLLNACCVELQSIWRWCHRLWTGHTQYSLWFAQQQEVDLLRVTRNGPFVQTRDLRESKLLRVYCNCLILAKIID